jgi:hypothetical protein
MKTMIQFRWADAPENPNDHVSIVDLTVEQRDLVRSLLHRAEAQMIITPEWYVGSVNEASVPGDKYIDVLTEILALDDDDDEDRIDRRPVCKFCGLPFTQEPAGRRQYHKGDPVCDNCWDERLRTTA